MVISKILVFSTLFLLFNDENINDQCHENQNTEPPEYWKSFVEKSSGNFPYNTTCSSLNYEINS